METHIFIFSFIIWMLDCIGCILKGQEGFKHDPGCCNCFLCTICMSKPKKHSSDMWGGTFGTRGEQKHVQASFQPHECGKGAFITSSKLQRVYFKHFVFLLANIKNKTIFSLKPSPFCYLHLHIICPCIQTGASLSWVQAENSPSRAAVDRRAWRCSERRPRWRRGARLPPRDSTSSWTLLDALGTRCCGPSCPDRWRSGWRCLYPKPGPGTWGCQTWQCRPGPPEAPGPSLLGKTEYFLWCILPAKPLWCAGTGATLQRRS